MTLALQRLCAEHIRYQRTSDYQVKVGSYNFYPGKGTITIDGVRQGKPLPERGLDNFIALVRKLKQKNPRVIEMKDAARSVPPAPAGFDLRDAK